MFNDFLGLMLIKIGAYSISFFDSDLIAIPLDKSALITHYCFHLNLIAKSGLVWNLIFNCSF